MTRQISLEDISLETLSEANQVSDFDCNDEDLNDFLLNDALNYQGACVSMTILAKYEGQTVGFFSLGMDCISLKSDEDRELRHEHNLNRLKEYPALKIHRLAVANEFKKMEIGRMLVLFVMGFARQALQGLIGVRFLSVDAYEESVGFYQKMDFLFNKHKDERYEDRPIFSMRCDLKPIVWPEESQL
jgi:ribosomal protein S18 acetylase RimI-like enzyme